MVLVVSVTDDSEYFQVSAHVGDNITLYCNTSLDIGVIWRETNGKDRVIYIEGREQYTHHSRFTVDRSVPGQYDLVMPNVQQNDSGRYSCEEDSGLGRKHIYTVNVAGIITCCFQCTELSCHREAITLCRVIEYFTMSLKVIQNLCNRQQCKSVLIYHCNYVFVLYCF